MTDDQLMHLAIEQARLALAIDEVPIGAVIYHQPTAQIIGTGHNRRIVDADPTAHAELLAIRQAGQTLGDWRLEQCTLAVTLEPCPMCAGAIINARIPRLVFGAADPKAGAVVSLYELCTDARLNHRVEVTGQVLEAACADLLQTFFKHKRSLGKK